MFAFSAERLCTITKKAEAVQTASAQERLLLLEFVEKGLLFLVVFRSARFGERAEQVLLLFRQVFRHLDVDLYAQIAACFAVDARYALALERKDRAVLRPLGDVNSALPSSVGTVTLAPSVASAKVMGISQ